MYLANQSNTQVYSPFGSLIVEQHIDDGERFAATQFEAVDLPSKRKVGDVLSNEQAAVGLRLQRYYPIHAVGPTPTRLQILLNVLLHRTDPK
jgi:hypothetical protein